MIIVRDRNETTNKLFKKLDEMNRDYLYGDGKYYELIHYWKKRYSIYVYNQDCPKKLLYKLNNKTMTELLKYLDYLEKYSDELDKIEGLENIVDFKKRETFEGKCVTLIYQVTKEYMEAHGLIHNTRILNLETGNSWAWLN